MFSLQRRLYGAFLLTFIVNVFVVSWLVTYYQDMSKVLKSEEIVWQSLLVSRPIRNVARGSVNKPNKWLTIGISCWTLNEDILTSLNKTLYSIDKQLQYHGIGNVEVILVYDADDQSLIENWKPHFHNSVFRFIAYHSKRFFDPYVLSSSLVQEKTSIKERQQTLQFLYLIGHLQSSENILFMEYDSFFCNFALPTIRYLINKVQSYSPKWKTISTTNQLPREISKKSFLSLGGVIINNISLLDLARFIAAHYAVAPLSELFDSWKCGTHTESSSLPFENTYQNCNNEANKNFYFRWNLLFKQHLPEFSCWSDLKLEMMKSDGSWQSCSHSDDLCPNELQVDYGPWPAFPLENFYLFAFHNFYIQVEPAELSILVKRRTTLPLFSGEYKDIRN